MPMDIELAVGRLIAAADSYRSGATKTPPVIDGNLLLALGCLSAPEPGAAVDPEDLATLLKILIEVAPCDWASSKLAPLLTGVFYKQGLKYCLASEDGAYALAVAIVGFLETDFTGTAMLIITAKPHVRALLREWVMPATDGMSIPSVATVCRALFVADWCDLMLPASADTRAPELRDRTGQYRT